MLASSQLIDSIKQRQLQCQARCSIYYAFFMRNFCGLRQQGADELSFVVN